MKEIRIDSNVKKIRGWKRRTRAVEQWKHRNSLPRLAAPYNYDVISINLPPLNRLQHRNPPGWLQKMILENLIELYHIWKQVLEKGDTPYYLKLWLYD